MENVSIENGGDVRFAMGKAVCPGFDELCDQISSDLEIEGQVVFLSDCGKIRGRFAIIQVKGIHVPLIVPVEDLRLVEQNDWETERTVFRRDRRTG